MPEGTSAGKFLKAVKYRQTDLTKVLTKLFKDPLKLANADKYQVVREALATENALLSTQEATWKTVLKPFMKKRIKAHKPIDEGFESNQIRNKIIDHIEDWPNNPGGVNGKEQLRKVLTAVIAAAPTESHPVQFLWELTRDSAVPEEKITIVRQTGGATISPDNPDITSLNNNEEIIVTFINPWSKVRDEAGNQVEVGLGPEDKTSDSVPA